MAALYFPCPVCDEARPVRVNRRGKVWLRCDECGVLLFINTVAGQATFCEKARRVTP